MNKLKNLLNERDPYIQSDGTYTDNFWWYVSQGHSAIFPKELGVEKIISKEYGFIKWLVDNDKIKREGIEYACYIKTKDNVIHSDDISKEGVLLMLLSIQDEPLKFLCSVLK